MSSLLTAERAKYEDIWTIDAYRANSPGEQLADAFLAMTGAVPGQTVLDAGCGAGRGAIALHAKGLLPRCCDLTDTALQVEALAFPFTRVAIWHDLGEPVDWVYCCDVLEHIPTPFTMLVIRRLLDAARLGVFLSISHVPDVYGVWVGQTLHETVQPFVWWRDHLATMGTLVEARDLLSSGLYMVTR